jgi:DNA-binding NtrC family response regulator
LIDMAGQLQRFSQWMVRASRARADRHERILVISRDAQEAIGRLCRRLRWEVEYAADLALGLVHLGNQRFDVVIYDQDLPNQDWRMAVSSLAGMAPRSSILLLSPRGNPELWPEVIRRGGHDMLSKPVSENGAESAVAMAIARAKMNRVRK